MDDIFQELCHTSLSFLRLSISGTELHNSTPATLKESKIHTVFLIDILDFPYLPFITENMKPPGLTLLYNFV